MHFFTLDQFFGPAGGLVGLEFIISDQERYLAPQNAALGVDLGHGQFGPALLVFGLSPVRSGQRYREAQLDGTGILS
jgi:hypothetical protein